jgi:hypothetical protein
MRSKTGTSHTAQHAHKLHTHPNSKLYTSSMVYVMRLKQLKQSRQNEKESKLVA